MIPKLEAKNPGETGTMTGAEIELSVNLLIDDAPTTVLVAAIATNTEANLTQLIDFGNGGLVSYTRTGLVRPDKIGFLIESGVPTMFYNGEGALYLRSDLARMGKITKPTSAFKTTLEGMAKVKQAPTNTGDYLGQQLVDVAASAIYTATDITNVAGWKTL